MFEVLQVDAAAEPLAERVGTSLAGTLGVFVGVQLPHHPFEHGRRYSHRYHVLKRIARQALHHARPRILLILSHCCCSSVPIYPLRSADGFAASRRHVARLLYRCISRTSIAPIYALHLADGFAALRCRIARLLECCVCRTSVAPTCALHRAAGFAAVRCCDAWLLDRCMCRISVASIYALRSADGFAALRCRVAHLLGRCVCLMVGLPNAHCGGLTSCSRPSATGLLRLS